MHCQIKPCSHAIKEAYLQSIYDSGIEATHQKISISGVDYKVNELPDGQFSVSRLQATRTELTDDAISNEHSNTITVFNVLLNSQSIQDLAKGLDDFHKKNIKTIFISDTIKQIGTCKLTYFDSKSGLGQSALNCLCHTIAILGLDRASEKFWLTPFIVALPTEDNLQQLVIYYNQSRSAREWVHLACRESEGNLDDIKFDNLKLEELDFVSDKLKVSYDSTATVARQCLKITRNKQKPFLSKEYFSVNLTSCAKVEQNRSLSIGQKCQLGAIIQQTSQQLAAKINELETKIYITDLNRKWIESQFPDSCKCVSQHSQYEGFIQEIISSLNNGSDNIQSVMSILESHFYPRYQLQLHMILMNSLASSNEDIITSVQIENYIELKFKKANVDLVECSVQALDFLKSGEYEQAAQLFQILFNIKDKGQHNPIPLMSIDFFLELATALHKNQESKSTLPLPSPTSATT